MPIWKELAEQEMWRGMRLSLHGKTSIQHLTPKELRSSVVKCKHVEHMWAPRRRDPSARKIDNVLSHRMISLGSTHTFDYNGLVLQGIWENVLLYTCSNGTILCWDLNSLQEVGWEGLAVKGIVTSVADLPSQSTFCIAIQNHPIRQVLCFKTIYISY